jgi:hypothetical protein
LGLVTLTCDLDARAVACRRTDEQFVGLYANAISLKSKSKMLHEYQSLTNHVLKEMGGFEIDGWQVRSEIEV